MPRVLLPRAAGQRASRSRCPPARRAMCRCCGCSPATAITLFDGAGRRVRGRGRAHGPQRRARCRSARTTPSSARRARAVHLAVGMPANERMDWLVEKATELGAASIQPLLAERSVLRLAGERAQKKRAHWQAIADRRLRAVRPQPRAGGPRGAATGATGWPAAGRTPRAGAVAARRARSRWRSVAGSAAHVTAAVRPGRRPHRARGSRPRWRSGFAPRQPGPARAARRDRAAGRAGRAYTGGRHEPQSCGCWPSARACSSPTTSPSSPSTAWSGWRWRRCGWMATLPVMGYVVGGALSTGLVARTQQRFGRKRSFQAGLVVALLLRAAVRLCRGRTRNFWLLCVGHRGGRLLQRQRRPVPLRGRRTGAAGRRARRPCRW